jgi:AcrR family transcriptional regulator
MTGAQPVTRRRRDRKAQLAELAADLFRRNGYHAVGIGDIAAAAGITGPAVYRHFSSKQEILGHVLLAGVDHLTATITEILDRGGAAEQRLPALTEAFARLAVERRDAVALWRWLGRHLAPDQQAEVRRRGDAVLQRWTEELRTVRPQLSDEDAELLCRAAMGVFGSPANYQVTLGKSRYGALLRELAGAVLACELPPPGDGPSSSPETVTAGSLASRREVLLTEATRLFRRRGYHAVTMEEIGAAAGIAGPSVYRHFASKADLMKAASSRMVDRLMLGAAQATAGAADAGEALDRLIDSYAETVLAHRDLMAVYMAEVAGLPPLERAELQRPQRAYVADWVRLVGATDPRLEPAESRVVVHAALTLATDLARTGRLLHRSGLRAEIATLMRAVAHRGDPAAVSGL